MTDFLNNLARRSLGSAETLQPRLPGLFEPLSPAAGLLDTPVPAPRGWREEQLNENTLERGAKTDFSQDRASQLRAAEVDADRMITEASNSGAHSRAVPSAPSVINPAAYPQASATMSVSPFFLQHPAPSSPAPLSEARVNAAGRFQLQSSRTGIEGEEAGGHLRDAETASKANSESRDHRAEKVLRLPLAHTPVKPLAAQPEAPYSGAKELPPPIQRAIESRIAPQAKNAQAFAPAHRTGSAEPVIHVTIGRIEVRAVQQQTSTPGARPTSAVMSLDEYLRRRSQRGGQ